jgi:hypothetical protein
VHGDTRRIALDTRVVCGVDAGGRVLAWVLVGSRVFSGEGRVAWRLTRERGDVVRAVSQLSSSSQV